MFCGSSKGVKPDYTDAAEEFGEVLVENNYGLVYGGAGIVVMGAVADAVLQSGGEVIGVIPEALKMKEAAHDGLNKLHVVSSTHKRKSLMAKLSDGFVALP